MRGRRGRRSTRRTASSRRTSSPSRIRPGKEGVLENDRQSRSRHLGQLENYPYGSAEGYELRMLALNVYRADGQTLIWRGTASGSISTDAASGDLSSAVQSILAAFPPR